MSDMIATNAVRPTLHSGRRRTTATACRRFGLGDVLILVAATALSLALTRPLFLDATTWARLGNADPRYLVATSLLGVWTLAILAFRWRSPRPARIRLFRQPGLVAAGAATLILVVHAVLMICVWVDPIWPPTFREIPTPFLQTWWSDTVFKLRLEIGPAVAGAWVVLWRSGRWRSERGWIDRLGRLIGIGWIALTLILLWDGVNNRRRDLTEEIARQERMAKFRCILPLSGPVIEVSIVPERSAPPIDTSPPLIELPPL